MEMALHRLLIYQGSAPLSPPRNRRVQIGRNMKVERPSPPHHKKGTHYRSAAVRMERAPSL